jgi:outer membrane protein OmpA-like peptidoglycan-associated protein
MITGDSFCIRHWSGTYVCRPSTLGEGLGGGELQNVLFLLQHAYLSLDLSVVGPVHAWCVKSGSIPLAAATKQLHAFSRVDVGGQGTAGAWENVRLQVWQIFERAVRSRGLAIHVVEYKPVAATPVTLPEQPSSESPREEELTWFEVVVLDEVGNPLPGVALTFTSGGQQRCTTDGSGKARVEASAGSFGTFAFANESAVRDELRSRWSKPQGKAWYQPADGTEERHTLVQVRRHAALGSVSVVSQEPHTVVLQPRIVQARLTGMWFDTSKTFLLPTARHSLQRIGELYKANPESDLLIVGHTDSEGSAAYNDQLSLERAEATVAYLTDDVDGWYGWYGDDKPAAKRWGRVEDELMIEAVADDEGVAIDGADPVRWFQRTRGLTEDGIAGPITRKALIKEYMDLDNTTLPADIRVTTHGCGEHFPAKQTTDGVAEQENRRVEIFFFDNPSRPPDRPDGILPPPPGANSSAGGREYPEWVLRTREVHKLEVGRWIRLLLKYEDGTPARNVSATVLHSQSVKSTAITDERGVLMIHGVQGDEWSLIDIEESSEVVQFQ